jgi:outer membrane lipoprotein-sorting protein
LNILRRASLTRLLLLCGLVIAIGTSATAIAFALGTGPTPPPKPLADAVHDALSAAPLEGMSANIELTNHLLEGANLAAGGGEGGELTSSPLLAGGSGRLWIAHDGRARLELQSEAGDTQVLYDGHTLEVYDAASNTLYRYTPPAQETQPAAQGAPPAAGSTITGGVTGVYAGPNAPPRQVPSVAKIEEAIAHLQHVDVSGALPTDVGGQPAYTVRVSPREGGSLLAGAELSFDADNGVPLRAAVYSTQSSAPVLELSSGDVSFGPVDSSVFDFSPPASAKIEEIRFSSAHHGSGASDGAAERPHLTTHGQGPSTVAVMESKTKAGSSQDDEQLGELPKVTIGGASASELRTELGTLLTFERAGVRYLVAGAVAPAAVEEVARGL